ncbi:MAG: coenzyme F420-0:L-glutamate ligase [Thaumarchaeota archaeon]|nr:coenzyme F420-0:L-glutamate ligase [Nitrososphaerota archaeon]
MPVRGIPEVGEGADLSAVLLTAMEKQGLRLIDGDVVVIKQKVVSKAEGRVVRLEGVTPGKRAKALASRQGKDPRLAELILRESVRVVREGHGVVITETRQGFVCANSGIDRSNVEEGYAALLPVNADASARKIRRSLEAHARKRIAVVVTDTFGRPWRKGQTDVALGCSGILPLVSYRGMKDEFGYELRVTEPAVVDEIASASELVSGKLERIPVTIVRGARYRRGEAGAKSIVMERERDLFR